MPNPIQTIEYHFELKGGVSQTFQVRLSKPDLHLISTPLENPPQWTKLENCQCPNCPLKRDECSHCPVALNLVELVQTFSQSASTEAAEIRIVSDSREYHRRDAYVQQGISSLMGLVMVTSGCPILDQLRPMVLTHLPFASINETTYRITSTYLLAQFFVKQRGGVPDWDMDNLVLLCEEIGKVNQAFSRRLISINPKDASLNALANLDCFQISASISMDRYRLKELEALFNAYFVG